MVTIFLRAILYFVGIATLFPVLMLIINSDSMTSSITLSTLYNALNFSSYQLFSIAVCVAVVAIMAIKNFAILKLYRFERDYIYSLYKNLSERLYKEYYMRGLGFIKQSNTAVLSRNVNAVTLMFVTGVLKPLATIISEGLLLILIFIALIIYTPAVAIIALVLFIPIVALFYLGMRRKLNDIGERENIAQRKNIFSIFM